jgi:predicted ArsR family transcriptional regulator
MGKTKKAAKAPTKQAPRSGARTIEDVNDVGALLRRGCTVHEYAEALGISRQAGRARLQKAVAAGVLVSEEGRPAKLTASDLLKPPVRIGVPPRIYRLKPAKG